MKFTAFSTSGSLQSMAEESKFSKYPRIAWGPTDDNKCAEQLAKLKVRRSRYLSESANIDTTENYTEPSKAKVLVRSSLSKLHLTPRLTYSPEQGKFFHFKRPPPQKPSGSYTVTTHPLTAAAKARYLTSQPLQHTSLSWISSTCGNTSKERRIIPYSKNKTTERKAVITNLAQVAPVSSNIITSMDSKREDTMQVIAVVCACVCMSVCLCMCVYACGCVYGCMRLCI